MDWLKQTYIAHWGYHSNDSQIPENSLKAFTNVLNNGYIIETDIRLTKDLQLIVFHDDSLARMCDVEGKIETYTLSELKKNIYLARRNAYLLWEKCSN